MGDRRVWQCDRCGFQMVQRHCKVICPNCGARWDCSDVTIWVGDGKQPDESSARGDSVRRRGRR